MNGSPTEKMAGIGKNDSISIVIPTYRRDRVLLDSLSALLDLEYPANEIIIVDQSANHEPETLAQLRKWYDANLVNWLRRSKPSITQAMNFGLDFARSKLVLFLDDDIVPHEGLVLNHAKTHLANRDLWATVGQVVQPWQQPEAKIAPHRMTGLEKDFDFPFNSTLDDDVENVMAGNLCVKRDMALAIGGFDENFIGPAYRFETDFARRIVKAGGKIRFVGSAGIHHLRVASGGTRTYGNHLTSASPVHGFGDYYYAFRHGSGSEAWRHSLKRLFREVRTRFHLTHPWWIPVKLLGETRALVAGRRAASDGPKLTENPDEA